MIITVEQLEKCGACRAAVTAFRAAIGEQTADVEWLPAAQYLMLGDPTWRQWWGWAVTHQIVPAWSMCRADQSGADLSGADLSWANLRGANLRGAYLSRADLSGADLSGADLRWADLSGADLSGADLRWADLRWADLRWADLSGVGCNEYTIGIERGAE